MRALTVIMLEIGLGYTPPMPEPFWTLTVFIGFGLLTIGIVLLGNSIANKFGKDKD